MGGFTLIELMVVVVVIAVLAAIALPAYLDSVRKSRRAEAVRLLSEISQAQERWRANNTTYTTLGNLYPSSPGSAPAATYYALSITSAAATGYQATASAIGAQAGDSKCTFLRLAASGGDFVYTSGGTATSTVCWSR